MILMVILIGVAAMVIYVLARRISRLEDTVNVLVDSAGALARRMANVENGVSLAGRQSLIAKSVRQTTAD